MSYVFSNEQLARLSANNALPYVLERINFPLAESYPVSMTIRPTSVCNRACNFCLCSSRNEQYCNAHIQPQIANLLFDDLRMMNVRGVTIAGGGEPTVLPPAYYSKLTDSSSCRLFWHTNGVLIDRYSNSILNNTSYISFSLLAHTHELYNVIAGTTGNQFSQIVKNAQHLCTSAKYSHITKQAKLLITKEIIPYLDEYYAFYRDVGFSKYKFSLVKNYEPGQNNELSFSQLTSVFNFLVSKVGLTEKTAFNIVYGKEYKHYTPSRCWVAELGLYATTEPDGRVFLCSQWCSDNSVCIGNINENTLREIWGTEKHNSIIKELSHRAMCKKCDFRLCRHYSTNVAIDLLYKGYIDPSTIDTDNKFPFI